MGRLMFDVLWIVFMVVTALAVNLLVGLFLLDWLDEEGTLPVWGLHPVGALLLAWTWPGLLIWYLFVKVRDRHAS